jgi:hypothetical protein
MFAFAPASRFGYGVYPLGLACLLLLATPADDGTVAASGREPVPRGASAGQRIS